MFHYLKCRSSDGVRHPIGFPNFYEKGLEDFRTPLLSLLQNNLEIEEERGKKRQNDEKK